MRCPQCGEPVLEGAHFCGECGARLDSPPRPTVDRAPEKPPAEASPARAPAPAEGSVEGRPDATANTVHDDGARNPKTAPMLQMPEFEAPGGASSGVRPTLPMADGRAFPAERREVPRTPVARRVAWITLGLVACAGLVLLFVGVSGGRLSAWRSETPPEEPPPISLLPSSAGQAGTEPLTPPPEPEPTPSAPPETPPPPARGGASPKPSKSAPPAKPVPTPTPSLPTLPSPTTPSPTTPSPAPPAPSLPTPPLPLPQLPWSLPTAGACERCLQALRGTGDYTVVSAAGEALLCEDGAARANCEREIAAVAPDVAKRAAFAGNCPAALATVAAAVNVGVPPDRFADVNNVCLR